MSECCLWCGAAMKWDKSPIELNKMELICIHCGRTSDFEYEYQVQQAQKAFEEKWARQMSQGRKTHGQTTYGGDPNYRLRRMNVA